MKFLRPLAAVVLLVVCALTSAAAPAGPGPKGVPARPPGTPAGAPRAMPTATPGALQAPLPDTTLVRIFYSKGRTDITLSQLRVGAYRLGVWPDSLTPQDTRQVLGLLVQQAILKHRVQQSPRRWTAADSSDYRLLEDRATLMAALDSALVDQGYRMSARGDTVPNREALGIMVRDSALVALHPVYDEDLLKRMAASFAAMPKPTMDQSIVKRLETASALPSIAPADSGMALLTCRLGTYTAGQLLIDMARMNPTRRPIVGGPEDLRDLCKSKIYETLLRQAVAAQGLAKKPRIKKLLAERADFLDVQRFVAREVLDKIPTDSTTLRKHFRSAPERFMAPAAAVVVRTVLDTQAEADSLAHKLTLPGFAESLVVQSTRAGIPYRALVDERSDSTLYRRALRGGAGAVIGPDEDSDGWHVLKVMELRDRRPMTFDEAYPGVLDDWRNAESSRRMRDLMGQLAASTIVNVNQESPYLTGRKRIPR